MHINYIAYDSLGVKSVCTQICTDIKILIDPGVSIQTGSYPLTKELREKFRQIYRDRIIKAGVESDIIVITHYHYDHHFEERIPDLYAGKVILLKDPSHFINRSHPVYFKRKYPPA